jgi:hypothetical protein
MGKGLLAWWRRRIVVRGLAGVALFAVPVGVAALIGFGTSLSGVAGGLSAVTNGPDPVPASSQTTPTKLNRAVVALAAKQTSAQAVSGRSGRASAPDISSAGGGSGGSGGSTGTSGGGSGGGSSTGSAPTISSPDVTLPGSGGNGDAGQTIDSLNDSVNNVVGGVDNTLNGLLGQ